MSNLVIVESPAKAKTIQKYLGEGFEVVASMGHIRDLPTKTLGVDIDHNFSPQYVNIEGKEKLINELTSLAKKSEKIFLATDPDREGEAISWHLANTLGLDMSQENRITFNEITKTGVRSGMDNPRTINQDLVNAQQARRILDRIVGYKLSPFLWKKVRKGLSAGRVQSVAVKLIVDREEEIKAFKTEEYWTIDAKLATATGQRRQFPAKLTAHKGKKLEIKNEEQASGILAELKDASYRIANIKTGTRKKSPAPPFITSTLQQEASRKLSFQARRTMKAAQELYEGVEVEGLGAVGLITYMRTDSLRISNEAISEAVSFIKGRFGDEALPPSPRHYKSKKSAQDAHEAIRPSMPALTPDQVKSSLTSDQYKLYNLIWMRFIASQMSDAIYDTVTADIAAGDYTFRASGFSVRREGFTALYEESRDDGDEEREATLPPLSKDDPLEAVSVVPNQHFTQPPARYSEATLIKALEENGIGRPSTYAPTITTVIQRGYVEREAKVLRPTVLGEVTTHLMEEQFSNIVDVDFTAKMEQNLDGVEEGNTDWVGTLDQFYQEFSTTLKTAEENLSGTRVKIPDEETDIKCELCGQPMVIKHGRFGKFLACTGFPECKNTRNLVQETEGLCPLCSGKIVARKSRAGKTFFGCENYPQCTFATWDTPSAEKCPQCGSTLFKTNGRWKRTHCLKPDCGFGQIKPEEAEAQEGETPKKPTRKSTKSTASASAEKTTTKRTTKASSKPEGSAGDKCDKCGGSMVLKKGRFGEFLACDNYPKCKNTMKLKKEEPTE